VKHIVGPSQGDKKNKNADEPETNKQTSQVIQFMLSLCPKEN
jgi:hypothetical protein